MTENELFGNSEQLEKDHFADHSNMVGDTISRAAAIDAIKEDKIDLTDPSVVAVFKATGDFEKVETQVMTCDRHIKILKNLPSEQPAQQWIPCSEVPDTDRNVFIARGDGNMMTVCIGHYQHDYKQWYEDRNWFEKCLYDGLYWCEMPPLPEP